MFIFFYAFPASYGDEMVIMPVKCFSFLLISNKILQGRLEYGSFQECCGRHGLGAHKHSLMGWWIRLKRLRRSSGD